jgi:hypothetical protein
MSKKPWKYRDADLALRGYGVILGYLQYDNTVPWTRSRPFLVANAVLLGFLGHNSPLIDADPWACLVTSMLSAGNGLTLTIVWLVTSKKGERYVLSCSSLGCPGAAETLKADGHFYPEVALIARVAKKHR